jgi:nucleoid-associated protein YgaU
VSPTPASTETVKSAPLLDINSPGLLPLPPLGEHAHSPGRVYIVQAGDTLSDIAQKLYGDSRHTDAILQANRAQLRSEQDLRPGMMLEAP